MFSICVVLVVVVVVEEEGSSSSRGSCGGGGSNSSRRRKRRSSLYTNPQNKQQINTHTSGGGGHSSGSSKIVPRSYQDKSSSPPLHSSPCNMPDMPTSPQRSALGLWSVCTLPSYWLQGNTWQGTISNQCPPLRCSLALSFAFSQTSSFLSSHLAIPFTPFTRICVVINMCQTLSVTSDVPRLMQYKNWGEMQKQAERRKPPMLSSVPSIWLLYLISACA